MVPLHFKDPLIVHFSCLSTILALLLPVLNFKTFSEVKPGCPPSEHESSSVHCSLIIIPYSSSVVCSDQERLSKISSTGTLCNSAA